MTVERSTASCVIFFFFGDLPEHMLSILKVKSSFITGLNSK